MQSRFVIKFCVAAAIGVLGGLFVHADYERWHRLGREAFLSHEAHRFDLYMADPQLRVSALFVFAVLALGFFALYEGLAYAVSKVMFSRTKIAHARDSGEAGTAGLA
jgi:hypothetical protein